MRHMLDYARETAAMVSGRSRGDVDTDRMLQLALHGYDTVNYDTVWKIINDELPVLIAALERALPGHVS